MKPGAVAHSVSRGTFYLALEKAAQLLSGVVYLALNAVSKIGRVEPNTGHIEMFDIPIEKRFAGRRHGWRKPL